MSSHSEICRGEQVLVIKNFITYDENMIYDHNKVINKSCQVVFWILCGEGKSFNLNKRSILFNLMTYSLPVALLCRVCYSSVPKSRRKKTAMHQNRREYLQRMLRVLCLDIGVRPNLEIEAAKIFFGGDRDREKTIVELVPVLQLVSHAWTISQNPGGI